MSLPFAWFGGEKLNDDRLRRRESSAVSDAGITIIPGTDALSAAAEIHRKLLTMHQ